MDKFGKGVGVALEAVQAYARQLFVALRLLKRLSIIHADIKPHNIVVDHTYNVIKLCDFGSAFRETDPDNEPAPFLVSRFYRAPEIILGFKHTTALDVWSVGCVLYELYTGHVAFPGHDNNDMLHHFQLTKGPFPSKMVRRHLRQVEELGVEAQFDQELRFLHTTEDPVTGEPRVRPVRVTRATEDLGHKLLAKKGNSESRRMVLQFRDLLERVFMLDPKKRITVEEAQEHPFLKPPEQQEGRDGAKE